MNLQEKKEEIRYCLNLNDEELEQVQEGREDLFKSWEYYNIFYFTNAELYYMDEDTKEGFKDADKIVSTEKGTIYAYS
jgi:hypothetical protein